MKIVLKSESHGEKCPKIYLRERNKRCEGGASLLTKAGMAECREKTKTDTHIHMCRHTLHTHKVTNTQSETQIASTVVLELAIASP